MNTLVDPEDDQPPNNGIDPRVHYPNLQSQEQPRSYPNLIRLNKSPYSSQNNDLNNSGSQERTPPQQRRFLRQSTLPNPDSQNYVNNPNLLLPVSPMQQSSPQYSPYHTDNEENESDIQPTQQQPQLQLPASQYRFKMRRQSTLPCNPDQGQSSPQQQYLSTSPNRYYSRSPDPSSDAANDYSQNARNPQRQLPTSPSRMHYNKSPDSGAETDHISPRRFQRQLTLPNNDQHIKLLPASPTQNPQYMKRSPEFKRQNTIPNPDSMNTLLVHQHGPKFLPISPRLKHSFIFPQPVPRPFLSQQHFPTMIDDQPIKIPPPHKNHAKMIKIRSYSNEESSFNQQFVPPPSEGRRMLPVIPRSPSRLVRQSHVKDDNEKRSPTQKTFAEANQNPFENYGQSCYDLQNSYNNEYNELSSTFAEADENNYLDQMQYQNHDAYITPDEYIKNAQMNRNLRRKSRELPANPLLFIQSVDEPIKKTKPEPRRSSSEDSPPRIPKIMPRRSMSHPEKETLVDEILQIATDDKNEEVFKVEETKSQIVITPDADPDAEPQKPVWKFQKILEARRNSKSFDAVVRHYIKNDKHSYVSQSMDDNFFLDNKEEKIQNAVEAAAGLFKKVVLQRRKDQEDSKALANGK